MKWKCHSLDVKAAYLQGNLIKRDVYLMPPPEYFRGNFWKLKKTVYGLCDAARAWYLRVRDQLLELKAVTCSLEPSLFFWKNNGILKGIICVYVDDFLWAGTKLFKEQVIDKMQQMFCIGSYASASFRYIGLDINDVAEGVTVNQCQYASTLTPVNIAGQRGCLKNSCLSDKEKKEYRALVGQLSWISTQTRPDVAFDVCELSGICKKATIGDALRLNKVISRILSDNYYLLFQRMSRMEECTLDCYTDASFANLPDGGSQGGFVIFLSDCDGNKCPLSWQSRRLRRVVKSTLAAETLALVEGAEAAVYLKTIIEEIVGCDKLKVQCYVDNKSLVEALKSSTSVDDRRLRIDVALLKDMMQRREVDNISWVSTSEQLADCLTKKGASTDRLREALSGH